MVDKIKKAHEYVGTARYKGRVKKAAVVCYRLFKFQRRTILCPEYAGHKIIERRSVAE